VTNIAFDIVPIKSNVAATPPEPSASTTSESLLAASLLSTTTVAGGVKSADKKPKRELLLDDVKHAIFRREVNVAQEDDNQLIEKNVSLEDDFGDTKTGKLIGSIHKSKKLTAK
jgi:hypothetical protein